MRKVIVLSALLLITGMSVYAQEDYSKSLKTDNYNRRKC